MLDLSWGIEIEISETTIIVIACYCQSEGMLKAISSALGFYCV